MLFIRFQIFISIYVSTKYLLIILSGIANILPSLFNLYKLYLAFNFPIDSCLDCGYQGEFNNECPECGSKNIQQLRRVTGYLTTDYRNFNEGKQAEVEERVKHSAYTSFGDEEK